MTLMDKNAPQPHEDTPPPQAPAEKRKRDARWLGFGLFCGIYVLSFPIPYDIGLFLPLMLSVWLAIRGRMRTAQGIWLGYACAAVLAVLALLLFLSGWAPSLFR